MITSTKTIQKTETIESVLNKKYLCTEIYADGELTSQRFGLLKPNHIGYEPHRMCFAYYGEKFNPKYIKDAYMKGEYSKFPKQKFVKNIGAFSDFDNLYCIWVSMDGEIYRLTDRYPLPTFFTFALGEYNIDKCFEFLKENPRIEIMPKEIGGWYSFHKFKYYPKDGRETAKIHQGKRSFDTVYHDSFLEKYFKLKQFRAKKKECDCEDDD